MLDFQPSGLKQRLADTIRELRNNRLASNAGWMFGGQVASFAVQAAYFVVLARLLGSTQYGVLAGAAALVNILCQYSGMGAGLLFLRYVSPDHSRFSEYWGHILLSIAITGTSVVAIFALTGKYLLGATGVPLLVVLAMGDCLCAQLTTSAAQVFQTFEKMRTTAALSFLTNFLRLLTAIGMTLALHRVAAFTWAVASLSVSVAGCLIAVTRVTVSFGRPKFSTKLLLARFGEGSVFAVSGSATTIYNDVDKVMLGHYGMTMANGIYSMAYRVINICSMPISSIHAAAFPRFFREGVSGVKATGPFALKILKRTSILGVLGAVGMFVCAPLLPHIAGPDFEKSVDALRWLCLIPLLRCFHLSAGDALAGSGFQRYRLGSQFIAAGGNFALNLYLIPRYSWLGAAWASLATDASLGVMNWTLLRMLTTRANRSSDTGVETPVAVSR